jgi:hypothetical protein
MTRRGDGLEARREGKMAYVIEERLERGEMSSVGEPVEGLLVAKVLASRSANRTGRLTVVKDAATGNELARYESPEAALPASVERMRASNNRLSDRLTRSKKTT